MGVGGNRKQLQRISPVQIFTSRRGLAGTENSCRASHQCIYSPVDGGWHSAKTAAENLTSANIHQSMRLAGTENSCRESHQCKYSPVDGGWHSSKTAAENLTSADIHQSKGVGIHRKQLQRSAPVKIFTSQWGLALIENSCRESHQCKYSPVNGGWHSSKTAAENLTSANIHQSMGLAGTENSCRASHQCKYSPVDGGWRETKTAAENLPSANIHQSMGVGGNRKQLQSITPVHIFTSRWGLAFSQNSCRESHQCKYSPVDE